MNIVSFYQRYRTKVILILILLVITSYFVYQYYIIPDYIHKVICMIKGHPACFANLSDSTCQSLLEPGSSAYGWCNDRANRGGMLGDVNGSYYHTCRDWIYDKMHCPPVKCTDLKLVKKLNENFGWCNDPSKKMAMRGDECGPYDDTCKNWIWKAEQCKCDISGEMVDGTISRKGRPCQVICGKVNGEERKCNKTCQSFINKSKNICGKINGKVITCPTGETDDCRCKN